MGTVEPSDVLAEDLRLLYDAEVAANDASFGRLLDLLDEVGIAHPDAGAIFIKQDLRLAPDYFAIFFHSPADPGRVSDPKIPASVVVVPEQVFPVFTLPYPGAGPGVLELNPVFVNRWLGEGP